MAGVIAVRTLIVLVLLAIVVVSAVPLLVLLDLVGGGDGWGLCPDGIGSCSTSYFDGLELVGGLMIVIFALLAVLRVLILIHRWLATRRSGPVRAGSPHPPAHSAR